MLIKAEGISILQITHLESGRPAFEPLLPRSEYLWALHYMFVDAKFKTDEAYESNDREDGVSIH